MLQDLLGGHLAQRAFFHQSVSVSQVYQTLSWKFMNSCGTCKAHPFSRCWWFDLVWFGLAWLGSILLFVCLFVCLRSCLVASFLVCLFACLWVCLLARLFAFGIASFMAVLHDVCSVREMLRDPRVLACALTRASSRSSL